MSTLTVTRFDAAERLKSPAEIAAFLNDAFETGSPDEILHALGIAARARGMSQVSKDTELGRESLYKVFRPGAKPESATALKVMRSLGLTMVMKPSGVRKSASLGGAARAAKKSAQRATSVMATAKKKNASKAGRRIKAA